MFVDGGPRAARNVESRRASFIITYKPKRDRHQTPARRWSARSACACVRCPTSASTSSTRTACAPSRWWCVAPIPASSPTSPTNSPGRCAGSTGVANVVVRHDIGHGPNSSSGRVSTSSARLGVMRRNCWPKLSESRRSAMSARRSPSSTPATCWCLSASSSTTAPGRHVRAGAACACPRARTASIPLAAVADLEFQPGPDEHHPLRPACAKRRSACDLAAQHRARRRAEARSTPFR